MPGVPSPSPSASFAGPAPALLIAKNHFSSVQLSARVFLHAFFSFSCVCSFFFHSLQKCFPALAARAVQAATLRASVSAVNSLNQKINKLNKQRAEDAAMACLCLCHGPCSPAPCLPPGTAPRCGRFDARPKMPGPAAAPSAALVACKMPKMQQCRQQSAISASCLLKRLYLQQRATLHSSQQTT